ncbi:hypothetical protein [Pedobacter sp. SYSU D00535]|uniref:hypothetical protein n=1 Tax=Pedobacter sp. SYSU D00535 TaxID=2810308 RepID=UPI001A9649D8|nr:hypothetical protein [Pedobacter sp. SYSU D00535]
MKEENKGQKYLTGEEISSLLGSVRKSGLRYTVDLYLLDYIKCCLLEDGQLNNNIQKLQHALNYIENSEARKDVEQVISSLQCVQKEYNEYLEDTGILAKGDYPPPRGEDEI